MICDLLGFKQGPPRIYFCLIKRSSPPVFFAEGAPYTPPVRIEYEFG